MTEGISGTIELTKDSSQELLRILEEQEAEFLNELLEGKRDLTIRGSDGRSVELTPKAKEGEWIPCSERLPTEEEQDDELGVLVTLGNGYSGLQYDWYHDGHWYDWNGFVVAWMPLPEPWKGADDGRNVD